MRTIYFYHDISGDDYAAMVAASKGYVPVIKTGFSRDASVCDNLVAARVLQRNIARLPESRSLICWNLFPWQPDVVYPMIGDDGLWNPTTLACLFGGVLPWGPIALDVEIYPRTALYHWKHDGISAAQMTATRNAVKSVLACVPPLELILPVAGSTYSALVALLKAKWLVDEASYYREGKPPVSGAIPGLAVSVNPAKTNLGTPYLPTDVLGAYPAAPALFVYPTPKSSAVQIAQALPNLKSA